LSIERIFNRKIMMQNEMLISDLGTTQKLSTHSFLVRTILFGIIWAATMGRHKLWLLPNLTEDCGFFESFQPWYTYEYSGDKSKEDEKKSKKKDKNSDDEQEEENEQKDENSKSKEQMEEPATTIEQEDDDKSKNSDESENGSSNELSDEEISQG
jgi:translocation protein SEC62